MAFIEWDESVSVQIQELDGHHQEIFRLINALHEAMRQRRGQEVLEETIGRLLDYVKVHFAAEERYFEEFSYDGAYAHHLEHIEYVKAIFSFKQRFHAGEGLLAVELMDYLKGWFVNHILKTDKLYVDCFREHGLR